jgi:small-conductance mechanosensitive channel
MPVAIVSIRWIVLLAVILHVLSASPLAGQVSSEPTPAPALGDSERSPPPVKVNPAADDSAIARRLSRILTSTGWFKDPDVTVRDGVVILDGSSDTLEHQRWAGELATKTEGVVAVINRIKSGADVRSTFGFARDELARLARQGEQSWPLILLGLVIILLAWLVSKAVGALARRFFVTRVESPLLLAVVVRLFSIPVFLLGVYFVLQVAGLTRLALTVLGGTGLAGIIIGFAFRDIAENFLASLLLSMRNPFRRGDLIEVAGHKGVVQNLNTRSTVLLTLDGTHVQIPNATVYKSTITNFSSNDSRRAQFTIGVGYDSPTAKAQAIIMEVLRNHRAVLPQPEPLVLVDELGPAAVNLKVSYWFDSSTYAPNKINSALLRISKNVLLQAGIELPDPAREIVFPKGVPLTRVAQRDQPKERDQRKKPFKPRLLEKGEAQEMTVSEGNLVNECPELDEVDEIPEATENLLTR